ncbi:hypothetical protein Sjap_022810 [Stephania japonica]|uniref:Uncharacterized protein n=1 Tax=Stephania japonica TaxID=461633 RepID=A0AAP0EWR6_9MAGN
MNFNSHGTSTFSTIQFLVPSTVKSYSNHVEHISFSYALHSRFQFQIKEKSCDIY